MNHFFFVQNLAEWHYSCRKNFNRLYLKENEPLNKEEIKALTDLRQLLQKYSFKPLENKKADNVFNYLLRYEQLKDETEILDDAERLRFIKTMKVFEPRFEKLWNQESENFSQVQSFLTKRFNQTEAQILTDLQTLFSPIASKKEIEIILLLSAGDRGGGGGANNGPKTITLECSSLKEKFVNYKLFVLWHEIAHLILKKYTHKLCELLESNPTIKVASIDAKRMDFGYIKELFIFSIFTDIGFMTFKYFPIYNYKEYLLRSDEEWFRNERRIFPSYLIYLNGSFMEEKLRNRENIPAQEMAKAIVTNHLLTKEYYDQYGELVTWFSYN